ncbi:diguanylate cyclase [Pseudomonas cremoricolorata]|uniref:diguanylate cyclase n=1 Tax=Pseudomonas cremoricolorata TaxID=157783 RepID=A0A089WET3_9PSED|nr:diguanylate cyclase [Pseudomonas cremoricolorata]AIR87795.1 histidine kinase [Pseudomonas cremoricolorata]
MDIRSGKGVSFVRRIYLPRIFGKAMSLLAVAAAVWPLDASIWLWALMLFNGLAWPHVAFLWASRSASPYAAERRNLLIDSLMAGFWAAAMQFNPLPCLTILSMVTMNNVGSGGRSLMLHGALAQLSGAGIGILVLGANLQLHATDLQVYASLPMLTLYPMALGWVLFKLATTLAEHKRQLGDLSRTDSLTGLFNHGYWKDRLRLKFLICQQRSSTAVIALIDIDHFKAINDTYGHVVGDRMLRQLSDELKRCLREGDLAGRYGGDEFCVIFPRTSEEQACLAMERLRERIAGYRSAQLPDLRVSLSIGLCAYRAQFEDAEQWLDEADRALYHAKHEGRDRVDVAPAASFTGLRLAWPE